MQNSLIVPSWYVLHTRSRCENVVQNGLMKKSVDAFLPKVTVRSRRRDRKKMIRVPLFPGYIFVKTNLNPYSQLKILKTIGVVRFIGSTSGPLSVSDNTVNSLKIMINVDDGIKTGQRFRKGDRVIVVNGPFAGVTGTFSTYHKKGRVMVYIDALGQYAAVEVNGDDIEKLPPITT